MLGQCLSCVILGIVCVAPVWAAGPERVEMATSAGTIRLELWPDKAPKTVANFLNYVDEGFYNGTIFHRVIPEFMVQGGGLTVDYEEKETGEAIESEANNGLQNRRGTIAMARLSKPHTAKAQFFINLVDNEHLDFRSETRRGWGYTVFGKVVEGMEVVDRIGSKSTDDIDPETGDVIEPAIILRVRREK